LEQRTVAVYEARAAHYRDHRTATLPAQAAAFAADVPAGTLRADLGCGPGLSLPGLGRPVVALDAAFAMVALASVRYPDSLAVQGDLEALPFRRGSTGGAWAAKCYQHVQRERLPMALAELHRVLAVGAPAVIVVFPGEGDGRTGDDDELPGRLFVHWTPDALADLLAGAGFDGVEMRAERHYILARARRARSLADTVGPGMRLLVCGLNPSVYAADAGVGFARPGNRFWPAAVAAGVVSRAGDAVHALHADGMGMTDLVKRATPRAGELTAAEYAAGLARVERLVAWLRPRAVVFVGMSGWRAAADRAAAPGVQARRLAGVPVYLMPSTSGANAHARPGDLVAHLRAAAALTDLGGCPPTP
jgi:TDG/mug DNA glycosylase family protein